MTWWVRLRLYRAVLSRCRFILDMEFGTIWRNLCSNATILSRNLYMYSWSWQSPWRNCHFQQGSVANNVRLDGRCCKFRLVVWFMSMSCDGFAGRIQTLRKWRRPWFYSRRGIWRWTRKLRMCHRNRGRRRRLLLLLWFRRGRKSWWWLNQSWGWSKWCRRTTRRSSYVEDITSRYSIWNLSWNFSTTPIRMHDMQYLSCDYSGGYSHWKKGCSSPYWEIYLESSIKRQNINI